MRPNFCGQNRNYQFSCSEHIALHYNLELKLRTRKSFIKQAPEVKVRGWQHYRDCNQKVCKSYQRL